MHQRRCAVGEGAQGLSIASAQSKIGQQCGDQRAMHDEALMAFDLAGIIPVIMDAVAR